MDKRWLLVSVVVFSSAWAMQNGAGAAVAAVEGPCCAICCDPLGDEVLLGEELFGCRHADARYHDNCMAMWVHTQAEHNALISCPFCRGRLRLEPGALTPLTRGERDEVVTELLNAAQRGSAQDIRAWLYTGIGVDVRNAQGRTALMTATIANQPDAINALFAHGQIGANANAYDHEGNTALDFSPTPEIKQMLIEHGARVPDASDLFEAVTQNNVARIRSCLCHGVDINARNQEGNTALDIAQTPEIEQMLVEHGARVPDVSDLFEAVTQNNAARIRSCLRHGIDANAYDHEGNTALDFAPTPEIKQMLIEHGARVPDERDLFEAVAQKNADWIRSCLRHGIDVNARDRAGNTVLDIAPTPKIERLLITHGARVFGVQDLFEAITQKNVARIRSCLRHGVEPDIKMLQACLAMKNDEFLGEVLALFKQYHLKGDLYKERCGETGQTILMRMVNAKNASMVSLLLADDSEGTMLYAYDNDGNLAFDFATTPEIKNLLEAKDRELKKEMLFRGVTALKNTQEFVLAAQYNKLSRVRACLKHGADINGLVYHWCYEERMWPALVMAADKGNLAIVQELLTHSGLNVNARNDKGDTALMCAVRRGDVEMTRVLLATPGIDVNCDGWFSRTPLACAVKRKNIELVRLLLMHPAIQVNNGCVLLALAEPGSEIEHMLIERGAHTPAQVDEFFKAVKKGKTKRVRALLDGGINPNIRDKNGKSALYWAIYNERLEMIDMLLAHPETDVNARAQGRAPLLIWAVSERWWVIVHALLANPRVDINVQRQGYTALISAGDDVEMVRELLSHPGVDTRLRDYLGRTVRELAHDDKIKAMIDAYNEQHAQPAPIR